MGYIQKFFKSKKNVENFIEENGMEEAFKVYGLDKLVMYKIVHQYDNTNLYYDDKFSTVTKVYNKEGRVLGQITDLMSPYYKKLGHFFGPCLNGNIVLYQNSNDRTGRSYGVFDKDGESIIPFGVYKNFEFLPNGVALICGHKAVKERIVTIHFDGTVKLQPFTYIEKDSSGNGYEVHVKHGETVKVYFASESVIDNMMDKSTEIGRIEKEKEEERVK